METTEGGLKPVRRGPPGKRWAARWILPAFLCAGGAVVWHAALPRTAHVEPKSPRLTFELHSGPNDGEPINSRYVELDLATNYTQGGFLRVYVNGEFLLGRPLAVNTRPDGRPNTFRTEVDIDLEMVYRIIDSGIFDPDSPPLTVSVALHPDSSSTRLVTFAEWSGYVGKPWIEFLALNYARDGGGGTREYPVDVEGRSPTEPPATLPILVHPLWGDSYFFLLAAEERALLTLSPEHPRLLRESTFIASGRCTTAMGNSLRKIIYLDTEEDLPGPPAYVVLWTFDTYRGWKRSTITQVRN